VRLRPSAYVTRGRPRGSIGSPPGRGAVAHADRSAPDWVRTRVVTGPPLGSCPRPMHVLSWDLAASGPDLTQRGPGPIRGVRFAHVEVPDHTRRFGLRIQGSGTVPGGSGPTDDALGYITSSGHVATSDPPVWRSRALLWALSSRPRLGRVVAWSHTQHFRHATKG
jgi:hypothetical protein